MYLGETWGFIVQLKVFEVNSIQPLFYSKSNKLYVIPTAFLYWTDTDCNDTLKPKGAVSILKKFTRYEEIYFSTCIQLMYRVPIW